MKTMSFEMNRDLTDIVTRIHFELIVDYLK